MPWPPSSCTLAISTALRLSVGARLIQLPSGSMPTISECACWEICRTRVCRYASGIQSFGSILSSASTLRWKRASSCALSPPSWCRQSLPSESRPCVYMPGSEWDSGRGPALQRIDHDAQKRIRLERIERPVIDREREIAHRPHTHVVDAVDL